MEFKKYEIAINSQSKNKDMIKTPIKHTSDIINPKIATLHFQSVIEITDADKKFLCALNLLDFEKARRIVASVNFCADAQTADLENGSLTDMVNDIRLAAERIELLQSENARLIEALKYNVGNNSQTKKYL